MGVDLKIAGIIPFSATDWPGKLTASAFVQGCPWRCIYCHNFQLQPFSDGEASFEQLLDLLRSRRGLLDGAVISGGEPTAQLALGDAIAAIHAEGFPVGLHTCGYQPKRLEALLADRATRPEWIGIDVKGLPADMPAVVGGTLARAEAAWQSLEIVTAAARRGDIEIEVRTTIWPGSTLEVHLPAVTERVAALGFPLVVHQARGVDQNGYYSEKYAQ
ncbi:MAG: anaerobic ribonucleoside-triphosphate reductase activating protein [Actinomycetaceae bacterium]|nr:anaerobic ribonucleoside-triphosphate reductase activating protein [Arcanobacterium sp.]MDD7686957.1 anaerobic ribonucleoside-triphosphate reductase activating protein [Actinomycetaceae bacterium]MDY5273388.1 anaerobic ribonucleoside-triphosphate reductase activating protein [Arcanobacterium sp.]